jgi:hypothetical protein
MYDMAGVLDQWGADAVVEVRCATAAGFAAAAEAVEARAGVAGVLVAADGCADAADGAVAAADAGAADAGAEADAATCAGLPAATAVVGALPWRQPL